jgi:hypothetical protein
MCERDYSITKHMANDEISIGYESNMNYLMNNLMNRKKKKKKKKTKNNK